MNQNTFNFNPEVNPEPDVIFETQPLDDESNTEPDVIFETQSLDDESKQSCRSLCHLWYVNYIDSHHNILIYNINSFF